MTTLRVDAPDRPLESIKASAVELEDEDVCQLVPQLTAAQTQAVLVLRARIAALIRAQTQSTLTLISNFRLVLREMTLKDIK